MDADERTMTNVNESVNESIEANVSENADECKGTKDGTSKWKYVAIGGVAGVMMGVAGTVTGAEGDESADFNFGLGSDADGSTTDAPTETDVPVATSVNDDMSFGDAFAVARAEVGAGSVFGWRGNLYNTYYAEEWETMTPEEREEFYEAAVHPSIEETPVDVPAVTTVPVATTVNDDMTFNEAFAAARAEVGAGGVFEWHGKNFNTYYAEEWEGMSSEEKQEFLASIADRENAAVADIDTADVPTTANVAVVDAGSSDDDVRVIGVYEENVDGQEVFVGAMEIGGDNVMVIDIDHDGEFDFAVVDVNGDGAITDNEIGNISDFAIDVDYMAVRASIDNADELLAANDMPDYVNDADVSMC